MVRFMSKEGSEQAVSSISQGNGPQVSECSVMGLGQSMTISHELHRPTMTSAAPTDVNEKQHKAIRLPRAGAKSRRENEPLKVKKPRARASDGRCLAKEGSGGGSRVPRDAPPRDSKGRFLAKMGNEEGADGGTIVNPYDGILNIQAPDFNTLLGIMYGDEYWTEVANHYSSIAHLQDPDFASLINFMNSIGYETGVEPYDAIKVLLKADGEI